MHHVYEALILFIMAVTQPTDTAHGLQSAGGNNQPVIQQTTVTGRADDKCIIATDDHLKELDKKAKENCETVITNWTQTHAEATLKNTPVCLKIQ